MGCIDTGSGRDTRGIENDGVTHLDVRAVDSEGVAVVLAPGVEAAGVPVQHIGVGLSRLGPDPLGEVGAPELGVVLNGRGGAVRVGDRAIRIAGRFARALDRGVGVAVVARRVGRRGGRRVVQDPDLGRGDCSHARDGFGGGAGLWLLYAARRRVVEPPGLVHRLGQPHRTTVRYRRLGVAPVTRPLDENPDAASILEVDLIGGPGRIEPCLGPRHPVDGVLVEGARSDTGHPGDRQAMGLGEQLDHGRAKTRRGHLGSGDQLLSSRRSGRIGSGQCRGDESRPRYRGQEDCCPSTRSPAREHRMRLPAAPQIPDGIRRYRSPTDGQSPCSASPTGRPAREFRDFLREPLDFWAGSRSHPRSRVARLPVVGTSPCPVIQPPNPVPVGPRKSRRAWTRTQHPPLLADRS